MVAMEAGEASGMDVDVDVGSPPCIWSGEGSTVDIVRVSSSEVLVVATEVAELSSAETEVDASSPLRVWLGTEDAVDTAGICSSEVLTAVVATEAVESLESEAEAEAEAEVDSALALSFATRAWLRGGGRRGFFLLAFFGFFGSGRLCAAGVGSTTAGGVAEDAAST